jgi:RNA polymerase sigma factor (sigma-70 family)
MADDFDLLDAWRGGDLQAGSQLFDRHFESIHRFLRNKVGDDTDEVMQRTLLACVETRDRFRGASSFRTYLFGVARLELLAHYRRRRKLDNHVDLESRSFYDLDPSPSVVVARHMEQKILHEALRRLPDRPPDRPRAPLLGEHVGHRGRHRPRDPRRHRQEPPAPRQGDAARHMAGLALSKPALESTLGDLEGWAKALGETLREGAAVSRKPRPDPGPATATATATDTIAEPLPTSDETPS